VVVAAAVVVVVAAAVAVEDAGVVVAAAVVHHAVDAAAVVVAAAACAGVVADPAACDVQAAVLHHQDVQAVVHLVLQDQDHLQDPWAFDAVAVVVDEVAGGAEAAGVLDVAWTTGVPHVVVAAAAVDSAALVLADRVQEDHPTLTLAWITVAAWGLAWADLDPHQLAVAAYQPWATASWAASFPFAALDEARPLFSPPPSTNTPVDHQAYHFPPPWHWATSQR
jgi:hypothetical protein